MKESTKKRLKRGCLISIAVVVLLPILLIAVWILHHNYMFDVVRPREIQEARERLHEIKGELTELLNEMIPVLKEHKESYPYLPASDKRFSRSFDIKDDPKWRELYGDEFAENVKKLCSYGFERIDFDGVDGYMRFEIFRSRPWFIFYDYYFEGESKFYKTEDNENYFGDGWFFDSFVKA